MRAKFHYLKSKAVALRKSGKTYNEIRRMLRRPVPKSTLSNWCHNVSLRPEYKAKIEQAMKKNIHKGRALAMAVIRVKREHYLNEVQARIKHLGKIFRNKDVAKIALAMLYLGEGSKTPRSALMFGNSDPRVIRLFVSLLRFCYKIDERKFRCTLQCRADQNIKNLEKFWAEVTKIVPTQFYKARVDARTVGKISKKPDYKGVCRIDYFSADLFNEIMKIIELLDKKGL